MSGTARGRCRGSCGRRSTCAIAAAWARAARCRPSCAQCTIAATGQTAERPTCPTSNCGATCIIAGCTRRTIVSGRAERPEASASRARSTTTRARSGGLSYGPALVAATHVSCKHDFAWVDGAHAEAMTQSKAMGAHRTAGSTRVVGWGHPEVAVPAVSVAADKLREEGSS